MKRVEEPGIESIPKGGNVIFVAPETVDSLSHYITRISLPEGIIRLANGDNFTGTGTLEMFALGKLGFKHANDQTRLPHNGDSISLDRRRLQEASRALASLGVAKSSRLPHRLLQVPNSTLTIGLSVAAEHVKNPNSGIIYTTNADELTPASIDLHSRLGIYRMLGEPEKLEWLISDIDNTGIPIVGKVFPAAA